MKHERISSKFTNSQINLSEAWEYFYKNFQAHRAQKDISEALEQFYSSKSLSEAHRAILTNHSMIVALSQIGVYSKDTKEKLTNKASKDTRRSKQNTWYVTNKNIAPSKIPMVVRRKRGCHSGASPSLVACFSLDISWGCGSIPKLRLLLLLIPSSIVISPKTWKLQSHKTQQNLREIR